MATALPGLRPRPEPGDTSAKAMHFFYFVIKFMPYWSIPLGLIFGEMGMIFRRRGNRRLKMRMFTIGGFFLLLTLLFFIFRWDVTLYPWLHDRLTGE